MKSVRNGIFCVLKYPSAIGQRLDVPERNGGKQCITVRSFISADDINDCSRVHQSLGCVRQNIAFNMSNRASSVRSTGSVV
jgi:hypothetical protein